MFAGAGGVHTLAHADDGSADRRPDSGADRRADCRDDGSADGAAVGVADGDTGTIRSAQRSCDEATRATQFQRDAEGGTGRPAVWPPLRTSATRLCTPCRMQPRAERSARMHARSIPRPHIRSRARLLAPVTSAPGLGSRLQLAARHATAAVDKQAACGVCRRRPAKPFEIPTALADASARAAHSRVRDAAGSDGADVALIGIARHWSAYLAAAIIILGAFAYRMLGRGHRAAAHARNRSRSE